MRFVEWNGWWGMSALGQLNVVSRGQEKPSIDNNIFECGWRGQVNFFKKRLMGQRFFFALNDCEEPVGVVSVCPHGNGKHFSVVNFFVEEGHRNKGVGFGLLSFCLSRCGRPVFTRTTERSALVVYKKAGFRVYKKDCFYLAKRS